MAQLLPHESIGVVYSSALYTDLHAETHFHCAHEFVYVLNGKIEATVDGTTYPVSAGECLLVSPLLPHSYHTTDSTALVFVAVFPDEYAPAYATAHKEEKPTNPCFEPSPLLREYLHTHFLRRIPTNFGVVTTVLPSPAPKKYSVAFSALCSNFEAFTSYTPRDNNEKLLLRITDQVRANFRSDLSLLALADDFGYAHEYLSRVLSKGLNINFKSLVNHYRCEYATTLLPTARLSLSEISALCGFQSTRSFNRDFLALYHKTPSDWRANR